MKRAILYTLAMMPTALLALPAIAGAIDAAAWAILGDTLIQPDWNKSGRWLVAWVAGMLVIPVGALTLSAQRKCLHSAH